MSIADEISKLQNNLVSSYSACLNKGATMPLNKNFDNLSATIGNITELKGQTRNVSLTSTSMSFTPESGYNGITSITVAANNKSRLIVPSTSNQTFGIDGGYSGNGTITVTKVTSSIDSNIQAGNIKKNITILGVEGTFEGGGNPISIPKAYVKGKLVNRATTWALPEGMKSIGEYVLYYAQRENNALTTVTGFNNITGGVGNYGCQNAFFANSALTSIDLKLGGTLGSYACANMLQNCTSLTGTVDVSGVTSIGQQAMSNFMNGCTAYDKEIHFDNLTTVSTSCLGSAFRSCIRIPLITFKGITSITASQAFTYALYQCSDVSKYQTWHPFQNLKTINGTSAFASTFCFMNAKEIIFDSLEYVGNTGSTTLTFNGAFTYSHFKESATSTNYVYGVRFPVLKTIGTSSTTNYGHFKNCMSNTFGEGNLFFPELTTVYNSSSTAANGCFNTCSATKIYMPKVTNFGTYGQNTFLSSTATTEIHFGIENQATIQALAGYNSKFGATNATLYFDLVNHITVNGVIYTRQGANCDYDTQHYSWNNGDDVIYTTNEWTPAVGDTVYTKSGTTYSSAGTISAVS